VRALELLLAEAAAKPGGAAVDGDYRELRDARPSLPAASRRLAVGSDAPCKELAAHVAALARSREAAARFSATRVVTLEARHALMPGLVNAHTHLGMNLMKGLSDDKPLMAWLSPAFPVGAFAYSHGLEWAVETGAVADAAGLAAWIDDLLGHGSGRSDAVLLAAAWRAITDPDAAALAEVAELAVALQPSGERHLEATQQGGAFVAAELGGDPGKPPPQG
jgi:hypothetical protein